MIRGRHAITFLRVFTVIVMAVGLSIAVYGFVNPMTIPLFVFDVPTWVIGVTCAYMGLRYWRRIPEMEKKIDPSGKFSWRNFSIGRGKGAAVVKVARR